MDKGPTQSGGNKSLKVEGLSRLGVIESDGGCSNSLKSLQPGSRGSAWQKVSQGNSLDLKPSKFSRPQTVLHFGLLDVPQPDTFSNSLNIPGSWRGGSHSAARFPEASDLASPLEAKTISHSQPIRPKAVSRKPGEVSSRAEQNHKRMKPALPRPAVAASNMEGSATSDDHENSHSRLIPRRGQGPGLRSEGGGKIDEYLMRLLNTGGPSTEPPVKQPETNAQRHVSRLGPLAGAGVMASTMQRSGSGHAKRMKIAAEEIKRQDPTESATQPSTDPPARPSHTQPSIAGENREEGRQGSQSVYPVNRKLSTELTAGNTDSMKAPALTPNGSSSGSGVQRVKLKLGPEQWSEMRGLIGLQIQEFQRQVTELHRLRGVQSRLSGGSPAVRPLPNHQEASQSSRPSWMNGSSVSWIPNMDSFGKNTEAFSWPAFQTAQTKGSMQGSLKQKSEPAKSLSQTTLLALDAQRIRRKLRGLSRAPSIGQQLSSGRAPTQGVQPSNNNLNSNLNSSDVPLQGNSAQDMQSMWLSTMQQQQRSSTPQGTLAAMRPPLVPSESRKPIGVFYSKLEQCETGYRATCIDFPGITAFGRTESSALELFKGAVKAKLLEDTSYQLPIVPSPQHIAQGELNYLKQMKSSSGEIPRVGLRIVKFD